jgi:hypothetical protein
MIKFKEYIISEGSQQSRKVVRTISDALVQELKKFEQKAKSLRFVSYEIPQITFGHKIKSISSYKDSLIKNTDELSDKDIENDRIVIDLGLPDNIVPFIANIVFDDKISRESGKAEYDEDEKFIHSIFRLKSPFNPDYQKFIGIIHNIFSHELAHVEQPEDEEYNYDIITKQDHINYFLNPSEVEAYIAGFKNQARWKKESLIDNMKKHLDDIINKVFKEKFKIRDDEEQKIRQSLLSVWIKQAEKMGYDLYKSSEKRSEKERRKKLYGQDRDTTRIKRSEEEDLKKLKARMMARKLMRTRQ